jgi:uncharacterized protein
LLRPLSLVLPGFAFAIVAAGVWLHFLAPAQAAALIVAFGLIVQGVSVWKLRAAIQWRRLAPFLVGGVIGVPIGGEILRWTAPGSLRIAIGALPVLFSLWNFMVTSVEVVEKRASEEVVKGQAAMGGSLAGSHRSAAV